MASPLLLLLVLTPALLLTIAHVEAQSAPAPTPSPLNLTGILAKGGQFTILNRLLGTTQIGNQIVNQLNNSDQGLTLFAPTDNAFNSLKSGTLNGLSSQQQVALILYHVLPKFYSIDMFDTISNPARTQATGIESGLYRLNFSTVPNTQQVNISTGIVDTQINNALYSRFPLAVYPVDKVLLPNDLFGVKTSTPAPSPKSSPTSKKSPSTTSSSAEGPATDESTPNAGSLGRNMRCSLVLGVVLTFIMGIAL